MKATSALSALCALTMFSLSAVAAPPRDLLPVDEVSIKAVPAIPLTRTGKVLSVIDVANYTYLEVAMDKSADQTPVWLAGPTTPVKTGAAVHFNEGMLMKDFHSARLNRTFANIFFVSHIEVSNEK